MGKLRPYRNNQEHPLTITPHTPDFREQLFFFLSGIIISVPFTLFAGIFSRALCVIMAVFFAEICSVTIFTPLIEEFAKAYPLFYRHGETERSLFSLGFLVGLGFGISEFFLYVLALGAPVSLRLPGLFFHAASTAITTYGIANQRSKRFYLIAVALHALYNFSALLGFFWFIGGIMAVLIAYVLAWRLFRKTSENFVK